jgi:2-keto-4-pentenoate hydratase/2-oxohepta-3-ene-1,7-dioic acid hydratase in catechol pathway
MDKIICVGKNYIEHARELGDAVPDKPVLFLKPPSVLRTAAAWGDTLELKAPRDRGELHHECEIVLRLARGGSDLTAEQAAAAIGSVSLGLDMTLRTVQAKLKKAGHPWTVSKVFADAAVVGPALPAGELQGRLDARFSFALAGQVRQSGRGTEMTLSPVEVVQYISQCFPLCEGDLIYTGTPAGVGPVEPGQVGTLSWELPGGELAYHVRWS